MRYNRTTGQTQAQFDELVRRVEIELDEPWNKQTGRKRGCELYEAVEIACIYVRQNLPQEFLGDMYHVSQSTVSRIVRKIVPIVKPAVGEYTPTAEEAIELVQGKVCLVDGTLAHCWSYEDHKELWNGKHGTTGFVTQLISLLEGTPVYISDPLDGNVHDAKAFIGTPVAKIVENSGGAIGDKGYQGCSNIVTPRKTPRGGELSKKDKENNRAISSLRAPVERLIAHFKSWRIFHTDYRRPYRFYRETFDAARALFFFSITWGFE